MNLKANCIAFAVELQKESKITVYLQANCKRLPKEKGIFAESKCSKQKSDKAIVLQIL